MSKGQNVKMSKWKMGRLGVGAALGLLLLGGMTGCQETRIAGFNRRLPPKPRPLPAVPADARANAIVLNLSAAPLDTNGNGYPDLIHATAHLFDTRYPPAIHQHGAFVFSLYTPGDVGRPGAEPLREWRIADGQLRQSVARSAFGGCYQFRLSLLEGGTDVLPIPWGDIVCRFEPAAGGAPISAGQVTSIQIGRRVVIPALRWREQTEPTAEPSGNP